MNRFYAVLLLCLAAALTAPTVLAQERGAADRTAPTEPVYRSGALILTVNTAWDQPEDDTGDGVCQTSFGCALRAAIEEANAQPDTQPVIIEFDIDDGPLDSEIAPGVWRLTLDFDGFDKDHDPDPLPEITQPNMTIDGETQPGASCGDLVDGPTHDLRVVLDGSLLNDGFGDGISASAEGLTVRGLVVQNVNPGGGRGKGIVAGGADSLVECNYVGTDYTGETAAPNFDGIDINGTARNNLVSGNVIAGIIPMGSGGLITRNLIGSDANGNQPLGNRIGISSSAVADWTIDTNLASANQIGILLGNSSGFSLTNNTVGLTKNRTAALGNGEDGIKVAGGSGHQIGLPGAENGNFVGGNALDGIFLDGTSGIVVEGNTIGLNAGGTARPNAQSGIDVSGSTNTTVRGNTVSGNTGSGIRFEAGPTSTGAVIEDNRIGTTADGTAARPNGLSGLVLLDATTDVTVTGNTMSGNTDTGVFLSGGVTGVTLEDNFIGTNPAGADLGNGLSGGDGRAGIFCNNASGIQIGQDSSPNTIRFNGADGIFLNENCQDISVVGNIIQDNGDTGIEAQSSSELVIRGNTASGNHGSGIRLFAELARRGAADGGTVHANGGGPLIEDNRIGTNAAGTHAQPNGLSGLVLGATATGAIVTGNTISGNTDTGVFLFEGVSGVVLEDNFIGTNAAGADLGNGLPDGAGRAGVFCQNASSVRIGQNFSPNRIRFNGADGIFLNENCQDISVVGNIIQDNGELSVDLAPDGPNPNDAGDSDTGANDKLNFPVITSAENDGTNSIIAWTLNAEPNTNYELLFCRNQTPDPSGFGECSGPNALATTTTNGAGNASGMQTLGPAAYPVGTWVTANATEIAGTLPQGYRKTSEFAQSVEVEGPGAASFAVDPMTLSFVVDDGEVSALQTLTISNTGNAIGAYELSVPVDNALDFNVEFVDDADGSVEPGSTEQVVVAADATSDGLAPGTYTDQIIIETTDPDNPTILVEVTTVVNPVVANEDEAAATRFALHPVYPNPFSREATVAFALPEAGRVTLTVYDVLGREVARLVDGEAEAGRHEAVLDGSALPSGVYLVRFTAGNLVQTQQITLLR